MKGCAPEARDRRLIARPGRQKRLPPIDADPNGSGKFEKDEQIWRIFLQKPGS